MHMSFKCSGMIKCYCIFRFLQKESTRKYITTLPTAHTWSFMSGCMFSHMLLKQFHLSWNKIFYFQSNSNDIYGIVLNKDDSALTCHQWRLAPAWSCDDRNSRRIRWKVFNKVTKTYMSCDTPNKIKCCFYIDTLYGTITMMVYQFLRLCRCSHNKTVLIVIEHTFCNNIRTSYKFRDMIPNKVKTKSSLSTIQIHIGC